MYGISVQSLLLVCLCENRTGRQLSLKQEGIPPQNLSLSLSFSSATIMTDACLLFKPYSLCCLPRIMETLSSGILQGGVLNEPSVAITV